MTSNSCGLRQNAGLTQEQLALAAGLDRPFLVQIEGGKRSLLVERLDDLASALGGANVERDGHVRTRRHCRKLAANVEQYKVGGVCSYAEGRRFRFLSPAWSSSLATESQAMPVSLAIDDSDRSAWYSRTTSAW
jgi:transcriptional regulator with XRE-family HTH domain